MRNRELIYLRKDKARRILESPMQADLKTFLSATFALTRNNVVKRHIQKTLKQLQLVGTAYKLTA